MSIEVELERCKQERKAEVDKYYQTVLLTLGLKDHFDINGKSCHFVSVEPRFFNIQTSEEVRPDLVLQYDAKHGILCEIKTSLPFSEGYLLSSLKQVEKYSRDVVGWDTPDRRVNDHDIILFCHAIDSDRVVGKVQEWLNLSILRVTKKLCICEWSMIASPKTGKEVILVRQRFGTTGNDELNQMLRNNILIDTETMGIKYEKCKFTRKEPPVEYLMQELWLNVFPEINVKVEDFETSVDEVLRIAYEYYIPWSNIEGEYSQIRKRWVKKALDIFSEIGLAQSVSSNSERFKIFRGKQIQRDILEYFIEAHCRLFIGRISKKPVLEEEAREQRSLEEFKTGTGDQQTE